MLARDTTNLLDRRNHFNHHDLRAMAAGTSTIWAFPVKLIGDEGKRCAAYRLLFARRFQKRALSSRRRAVRERVTNRLAPIATLTLPSHKG
jgi:cytochrome P450